MRGTGTDFEHKEDRCHYRCLLWLVCSLFWLTMIAHGGLTSNVFFRWKQPNYIIIMPRVSIPAATRVGHVKENYFVTYVSSYTSQEGSFLLQSCNHCNVPAYYKCIFVFAPSLSASPQLCR